MAKDKQKSEGIGIGAILAIGVGFVVVDSIVKNNRQQAAQNEIFQGDDPTTGQNPSYLASLLHQAMNPSGVGILKSVDGTDEDVMFNVSRQIKNYAQVSQRYKDLYKRDLTQDIENELNDSDLATFRAVMGKGNAVVTKPTTTTNPTKNPTVKKFYARANNTVAYQVNKNGNGAYVHDFSKVVKTFNINQLISESAPVHFIKINQSNTVYSVFAVSSWFGLFTDYFMVRRDLVVEK